MLAILTIFIVFNKRDYEFLAQEQGTRILTALYNNTELRLSELLLEPQRANVFYEDYILRAELYNYDDTADLERYSLEFVKKLRAELPQISALGFGDEIGNYIGFRVNEDKTYGLMVKDKRTDFNLNIYSEETMKSELVGSFEGYDPRTRPWYIPVKSNQEVQWSDVYVNYDEKMDLTITSLLPIIDQKSNFKGVIGLDVKLNMINDFLVNEEMKGNGVIYIVDRDWNILAHSLDRDFVKVIEGDPPSAVLLPAFESDDEMIMNSANNIIGEDIVSGTVDQIQVAGERHFSMYSPLKDPEGLGWRIVVVIPEKDIMGAVQSRQNKTLYLISIILILGMLISMYVLSIVIKPILQSSEAAMKLSYGDFETNLETGTFQLYETRELVYAFNNMSDNLKDSFEKIKFSENKYRSLIENVDDMIYSISADGRFISMNNSFEVNVMAEKGSLIGKHFNDIFETDANKLFWNEKFKFVLKDKVKLSFKFEYTNHLNDNRTLSVKLIPQLDDRGQVRSVLGTNTDISELIRAQEEIERLLKAEKKVLEETVEKRTSELQATMKELLDRERLASLGSLVAGIAHEINTPIGVAVTAGSYMEKVNDLTFKKLHEGKLFKKDLVDYMKNMEESSEIINTNLLRASELIRSFKEISVNQSIETLTEFMVQDYIKDVMLALKHEYKNTLHEFIVDCDAALEIRSYPGAFSQILTNLIMNSLTHGFDGVEKGHMKISAMKVDATLILEYEDDGVGISKDNLTRIFDPFFTTNRKKGGSGLGLNIVYNIVTGKLDGKISCESQLDVGTKFIIRIPLESRSHT